MGRNRININQLRYLLKSITWRIIPKKYRKPFYLFGGILGLVAWFNFLTYLTQSKYLILVKSELTSFKNFMWNTYDHKFIYLVFGLLVLLFCLKYFRVPTSTSKGNEDNSKQGNKQYHSGSIYYQVNSLITILYVVILVLAFLK